MDMRSVDVYDRFNADKLFIDMSKVHQSLFFDFMFLFTFHVLYIYFYIYLLIYTY